MDSSAITHAQAGPTRARTPGPRGDRLARWLRWLRWPVVVAWILAVVLLHGLSGSLSRVTSDGASAYLPATAASTKVALLQQAAEHSGGQPQTNAAIVVFATGKGTLTPAE
jgi:putative drug exporter of the RND superfamily